MQRELPYEIALERKKFYPTIKVCHTSCIELFAENMKILQKKIQSSTKVLTLRSYYNPIRRIQLLTIDLFVNFLFFYTSSHAAYPTILTSVTLKVRKAIKQIEKNRFSMW